MSGSPPAETIVSGLEKNGMRESVVIGTGFITD